jgi:hypothetical protein
MYDTLSGTWPSEHTVHMTGRLSLNGIYLALGNMYATHVMRVARGTKRLQYVR